MNAKEIGELRRRIRPDRLNMTRICGCYVNEKGEILSIFSRSPHELSEEETGQFLALFRKTLSGKPGQNLLDLPFSTAQVADSSEHRLLMRIRDSLRDEEAVRALFQLIIQAHPLEGNYLILLTDDTYDLPARSRSADSAAEDSSEVFRFFLCCLCPVKPIRPALCYVPAQGAFLTQRADWVVSAPECGFLFPAFDDRSANLYGALYYSRSTADLHAALIDGLFHTNAPMPADQQKEIFHTLLADSLGDCCQMEFLQALREEVNMRLETHRQSEDSEPLQLSAEQLASVFADCGASPSQCADFSRNYTASFGEISLRPDTVIEQKKLEICTPDVRIQVNPERPDLVETRRIGNGSYILVRAEGGIQLNGVPIRVIPASFMGNETLPASTPDSKSNPTVNS